MRYILLTLSLFWLPSLASGQSEAPDITKIAAAYETWEADPKSRKKVKALKQALAEYNSDPTVETVTAHISLLSHSVENDRPRVIRETALAAVEHLEPVAEIVPKPYGEAAYVAAISLFNHRQNPDAMLEMAEVEGRMSALRDDAGDRPDYAEKLYWQAQAWRGAMEAYFVSTDSSYRIDEDGIDAILEKWETTDTQINAEANDGDQQREGLPFCEGRLIQSPKMKYPRGNARKGMFGSLIVRFAFDADGSVIRPEILASIPIEGFEADVKKTVQQWTWEASDPLAVDKTCTLSRENLIQQFIFALY
ncbi:MAG: TonB family protein [Pseudomonadota bacterium]